MAICCFYCSLSFVVSAKHQTVLVRYGRPIDDSPDDCGMGSFDALCPQALDELRQAGLDEDGTKALKKLLDDVRTEEGDREPEGGNPAVKSSQATKLGGLATSVVSRLVTVLSMLYEVRGWSSLRSPV